MSHFLVVAHQTAGSELLAQRLGDLARLDPRARFSLLVPATHPKHIFGREEGERLFTYTEQEWEEAARKRGEEAAERLRAQGLTVEEVIVGDDSPLLAIEDEFRARPDRYDAVVVSTLPKRVSRWLRMEVTERARRRLAVPVLPVYEGGEPDWSTALEEWRHPRPRRAASAPGRRRLPRLRVWHIAAVALIYLVGAFALAMTVDRGFLLNDVIALVTFGVLITWLAISERSTSSG